MARNDFRLRAILEAEDRASGTFRKAGEETSAYGRTLTRLQGVFLASTAAIGGLVAGLGKSIAAYAESEQATLRLEAAARQYGDAAEGIVDAAQDQASALQRLTGVSDDVIKSQQAVLLQMGVLPGQLDEASRAAVDLSAALGISLESAFRNVGRTVGGYAGELGELVPELKDLTTEQLRAGEGVTLLSEKFDGAAESARGLSVQFAAFRETLGDTVEVIGQNATAGGRLAESLDVLTDAIASTNQVAAETQAGRGLGGFIARIVELGAVVVGTGIPALLGYVPVAKEVAESSEEAADGVDKLGRSMEELSGSSGEAVRASNDFAEGLERLGVILESEVNAELEKNAQLLVIADEAYRRGEITRRDFERIERAVAEAAQDSSEAFEAEAQAIAQGTGQLQAQNGVRAQSIQLIGEEVAALERRAAVSSRDQIGRQPDSIGEGLEGTFTFIDTSFEAQAQFNRLTANRNRRL